MIKLDGKVCIVTGAAQGIGASILCEFARAGARVVACDIDTKGGQARVSELVEAGFEALFVPCDVSSTVEVRRVVDATLDHFGGVDVAVNNAAILPDPPRPITDFGESEWMHVINVNLGSVFRLSAAVVPHLVARGGGSVISLASIHHEKSFAGLSPYAASKGGIVSLTRQLAVEYGDKNVRFNTISPGAILTRMTQQVLDSDPTGDLAKKFGHMHLLERIGSSEEVAATALFLASDGAAFITGQDILVDGGISRATRL
ncbi:SDR family NAD(P)-dependent oxidoreductase [Ensifer sp. YR511]|uniref:SDR family NAD(P)-dependent oxidoreductase n=1 Tax=Ensifer sp. YR511 TaxID=1855294 RepID=UPI000891FEF2|nr:SDR family oxidoreductase [Ensifer sp. YR511]SDN04717.1 NAD(P)-dependent dehydrogenase, short-chain alcohol dehydrogenase family [Ensifer sp. YR511]